MRKEQKRLLGYILTGVGIILNVLGVAWIFNRLEWIEANPPVGASSGAVGAFILFMMAPLALSWVLIFYGGAYLKEAKEI